MKTLLCAVSHGLYPPWIEILKNGQEKTWISEPIPTNIEVLHYHATPVSPTFQKLDKIHEKIRWSSRYMHRLQSLLDTLILFPLYGYVPKAEISEMLVVNPKAIHISFPDTYLTFRWKFLGLLQYFINSTTHDFLLTTTSSSYINLQVLSTNISSLRSENLYYGAQPYEGADFISGSNRIISRDIALKILAMKRHWPSGTIEDVAVGQLLAKAGITPNFIPLNNIETLEELNAKTDVFLRQNYHYRVKAGTNFERGDVEIMKALHTRLTSKQ